VVALRWGSHPFGKYAIQNTKDGYNLFPELIHSSGDLMMEERQLINDLIKILSAPYDDLDKCIKASPNFELYKACFDFMRDPSREDLIQPRERLSYRLYQGLPISSSEASLLPKDVIAADKVLRKQPLNNEEINVLLSEGVAYRRGTKINLYNEKILGLQFDTYQYVVVIQKYAHHYEVLRQHWKELSGLRRALLQDFNNFVIKDPVVLHNFTRELMLKRTRLEKLTQEDALNILAKMLGIE
jgi:hypothetical protein